MRPAFFWDSTQHRMVVFVPTLRDKLSVPSSEVKQLKKKMGPIRCPETSVLNYHFMPCKISKEYRSHLHRSVSLISWVIPLVRGIWPLKHEDSCGYCIYHQVKNRNSAFFPEYLSVSFYSCNKQRFFPCTALTDWSTSPFLDGRNQSLYRVARSRLTHLKWS